MPRRLTFHPAQDIAQGFTPDGKRVLFVSNRGAVTTRLSQVFTVPVDGVVEEQLPIPNAFQVTYSPDGRRLAYNPLPRPFDE